MSKIEIGKYGEKLACEFLIKSGCKIVETNYKYSRYGEIDIIALDKDELCFIEVKTRTSNAYGGALEAITKNKLLKIFKCLEGYKTDIKHKRRRVDAIAIELQGGEPKIRHIKNVEI